MSDQQEPIQGPAAFLPVLLASMAGLFFLLVMLLLTGSLFFLVLLFFGFVIGVGALHWIVWGKMLTERTAGEREEEELRQRAEQIDDHIVAAPRREEHRFRR